MPYYSDEIIEEVQSRNDIVDVISQYVNLKKKGSTYFGLCPFHNEKTASFSVSPQKQMYYCFGCGAGGSVFTFIQNYENYSFPEAMEMLADRVGVELPKQERSEAEKRRADRRGRLLEVQKEAAKYFYTLLHRENGKKALEYFREKRELSEETIRKFGLGYSDKYSDDLYKYLKSKGYEDDLLRDSGLVGYDEKRGGHDKFWNRAMFPIMDIHNKVIGFGGRVMGDGEPKYLNSPETMIFDKSRNLYALNIARQSRRPYIILCEGYMDVISLHQAGFDCAVASLGTAYTVGHATLLKRYTKDVLLSFDSDGAGINAALRAIPICKEAGLSCKVINMTPYKDPDEFIKNLGAEEYQKRIEEAENSFFFEIRILQRNYDMKDPESKTAFHNEIAKRILQFEDAVERDNYIEAVADKYHIGFENLRQLVNRLGTQAGFVNKPRQLKSGIQQKQKKDEGIRKSQKLLLTWLIEDKALYEKIKRYINPKDFTEELYEKVSEQLFAQLEEGEVVPARILNQFPEEEEQKEIAAMFNTSLQDIESRQDKEKALKETILRIKRNSIKERSEHNDPTDMEGMMQLIEDKRNLEKLEKMQWTLV